VDEDLPTRESHRIAEEVCHQLFHDQPHLSVVNIHVDPYGHSGADPMPTLVIMGLHRGIKPNRLNQ
jgi:divalent metal cation (Fe/Co/Zn/Cd) transporter